LCAISAYLRSFPGEMRHRFRTTQWLPYPVESVFAFFANPANLPKLQPGWQQARIDEIELHPASRNGKASLEATIAAGRGTRMTLSFRPTPLSLIRVSWVALVEDFHWNERFCDRQIEGPFRYWRQFSYTSWCRICPDCYPVSAPWGSARKSGAGSWASPCCPPCSSSSR